MRCRICLDKGIPHKVYFSGSSTTLLRIPSPYWDENDNYIVPPDPNIVTKVYDCSNGHRFTIKSSYDFEEMAFETSPSI